MQATRLILIRHGETAWNLERRYCGFNDVKLNPKGRSQARSLRKRLKSEAVDKIYTSDRKRAIETAKIIFGNVSMKALPGLREMHFGVFEGLTHKEILKKHGKVYSKWLDDPFRASIPRGEHLRDFKKRILRTLKKIVLDNRGKTVAVVCHGGSISIYLTHILKSRDFWKFIPHSTGISIMEFKKGKPKIHLLNCAKHLEAA